MTTSAPNRSPQGESGRPRTDDRGLLIQVTRFRLPDKDWWYLQEIVKARGLESNGLLFREIIADYVDRQKGISTTSVASSADVIRADPHLPAELKEPLINLVEALRSRLHQAKAPD